MKSLLACCASLLFLPVQAAEGDKNEKKRDPIDAMIFDADIWKKTLEELKGAEPEESAEKTAMRETMAAKGVTMRKGDGKGFEWLSSDKDGLRADPEEYELLGKNVGEVIVRGRDGKPVEATVSIFNRGDDGEIPFQTFNTRMTEWKALLDAKLAVRADVRDQKGAVALQGWMWKKGDTAVLLEGSVNRSEKRAEFIRLRFASISAAKTAPSGMARRGTFAANVKKDDKGFTWVEGIPMVDQGQKGYCVVASIERVARYFGAEMDQHEMAQLANTDEGGTNGADMEKAFQKVTGKIHLRTLQHIEYDERQAEKDLRGYNSAAKKAGVKSIDIDTDYYRVDPRQIWLTAHKETFRDMKRTQGGYAHFNRKIKEYVDQGIPLCWTLYLGMFKEKNLPQSFGGHMRLIIGYNSETEEIYYTDSWGDGHEKKTMRADEAYCMTMALYSMVPNK